MTLMSADSLSPEVEQAAIERLEPLITPERLARIDQALALRTQTAQVVIEDIFQPHNASACIRSCECFGVQDIHIVENRYAYRVNPDVVMGASKWIDMHRWSEPEADNTARCLGALKERGFRIAATALRDDALPLSELPVDENLALCFGTEEDGLSRTALEMADVCVKIPMFGFTQSFNISVSCALCLYEVTNKIRAQRNDWALTEGVKRSTRLKWLRRSVRNADPSLADLLPNKE